MVAAARTAPNNAVRNAALAALTAMAHAVPQLTLQHILQVQEWILIFLCSSSPHYMIGMPFGGTSQRSCSRGSHHAIVG